MEQALYKFWSLDRKWIETKKLTEKDIALIIDGESKTIFIWEGQISTPKNQYNAKELLGNIKIQYPDYKFRMLNSEELQTTKDVKETLEQALQDTEDIQLKISINKDQLELASKIIAYSSIFLIIFLLGRILSQIMTNMFDITQNWVQIFETQQLFSNYMQVNSIIALLVCSLMISNIVLAIRLEQKSRILLVSNSLLLLIIIIFASWQPFATIIMTLGDNYPLIAQERVYYNFIWSSGIILLICSILLVLSIYHPNNLGRKKV